MKSILFVSNKNACRTQMAEAFAKIHGSDIVCASVGVRPEGNLCPKAVRVMEVLNYSLKGHKSDGVDQLKVLNFDAIITIGDCIVDQRLSGSLREEWQIPDPKDMEPVEFIRVRDIIEAEVKILLSEL